MVAPIVALADVLEFGLRKRLLQRGEQRRGFAVGGLDLQHLLPPRKSR